MVMASGLFAAHAAVPEQDSRQKPVLMQADKIGYDQNSKIVVALGNVEVVQGESVLRADKITYYQMQNVVRATGNVVMMDKTGQVFFSDQAQVTGDLKKGIIYNLRTQTADNSRFAARQAERLNEREMQLQKAAYSPCELCEDSDPLWQLKADEINIDSEEQMVTYDDAWLELWGLPILYTPYLSHPTPGADRKSGLLTPEYGSSSNLGTVVKVPYYWNIAPDKDATFTSYFTGAEGYVQELEYRQLFEAGEIKLNGSGTFPDERDGVTGARTGDREFRGHIFAEGRGDMSEHWNWGFDVARATDDTYLRRYGFGDRDVLQSRLFFDRIEDRSYLIAQSLAFQGLELNDDPDVTPLIMPLIEGEYESDAGLWGSRWRTFGNALVLKRTVGSDMNRLTGAMGWRLPLVSDYGHVFELDAQLRTDFYNISDNSVGNRTFDEDLTRVIPRLGLSWKYPLVNHFESGSWVAEPTAVLVTSSRGHNPLEVPNEDSLVTDFSDLNIFAYNRFAGYDRVEEGSRATYGLRTQWSGNTGEVVNASFGQSFNTDNDGLFPDTRTYDEDWSDYVGQMGIAFMPVDVNYRFRLAGEDFTPLRHEVISRFDLSPLTFGVNYLKLTSDPILSDREEVRVNTSLALTDYWTLQMGGVRDIEAVQSRNAFVSLIYSDECITLTTLALRDFTRDRDVEPNDQYLVNVILKNIN